MICFPVSAEQGGNGTVDYGQSLATQCIICTKAFLLGNNSDHLPYSVSLKIVIANTYIHAVSLKSISTLKIHFIFLINMFESVQSSG